MAKPRGWLSENPVKPVPQHEIVRSLPERLEIETARTLMQHLEANHPEWCLFFAIALFLGVRPDMANGEMAKLAAAVRRDVRLCLYYPGSSEFSDAKPLVSQVLPWTATWLYYFEEWAYQ